eukprot:TRINITY_DN6220_c0_g1_i1.p1 TRINITY_DN6220_c0_g1~~TRINITY_DN6220_c0_g1_i1.p1  ORF type:complete len:319 (-),score=55.54 TRINITY_DN6220_c0_g1_i1:32-988(-)
MANLLLLAVSVLSLAALSLQVTLSGTDMNCKPVLNWAIFDLESISRSTDYMIKIPETNASANLDDSAKTISLQEVNEHSDDEESKEDSDDDKLTSKDEKDSDDTKKIEKQEDNKVIIRAKPRPKRKPKAPRIYWNLCNYTRNNCPSRKDFAKIQGGNYGCIHLTGDHQAPPKFSLLDPSDPAEGIQVNFGKGDMYAEGQKQERQYSFTLNIFCDRSTNQTTILGHQIDGPNIHVNISSHAGCPALNISEVWVFIQDYKYIFASFSVFVGLILVIFGFRLAKVAFFLLGFAVIFMLLLFVSSLLAVSYTHLTLPTIYSV